MPLSRSNRIDRRRRVILDAAATDSEFAAESVRAKKRLRSRENLDLPDADETAQKYRDPGYSQAVRKPCQQRMVQLIPVRRGTLSIVLSSMWMLWGALLFSHYWIFTRFDASTMTAAEKAASFATLPIAQLFHLRSSHSIAQWLTTQLWMLTAVAAWMIFQLRRHKLDDYRARYRIWVILAIAAAFSSFEASSSGLLLLGLSIDSWAQREIGYAGWPLVLAIFASVIGVIGIRLCSELKSAPMSVVSWLLGLVAWGLAALLGTGLLKITWSPATVDLMVGGCLLGGILAVFQASGIYLRQTYIHAQKRFLVRNGANLAPIQWKVPKLSLRRKKAADAIDEQYDTPVTARQSKWKMPWARKPIGGMDDSANERSREIASKREPTLSDRNSADRNGMDRNSDRATGTSARSADSKGSDRAPDKDSAKSAKSFDTDGVAGKPKGRLFGIIPSRQERNEKPDAEPTGEDDGPLVDQGLTKKRGWFGIGGNRDAEVKSTTATPSSVAKPTKVASKELETDKPGVASKEKKRSFWSRGSNASNEKSKTQPDATKSEANKSDASKAKRGWVSKFSKSYQQDQLNSVDAQTGKSATSTSTTPTTSNKQPIASDHAASASGEAKRKKSLISFFASRPLKDPKSPKVVAKKPEKAQPDELAAKSVRRGLFGMLDGLRLKPPTDEAAKKESIPVIKPIPIKQGQQMPSTQPDSDDEDGDDDYSGRPMSKADRKKLRRQSQDDRRAA